MLCHTNTEITLSVPYVVVNGVKCITQKNKFYIIPNKYNEFMSI